MPNWASSNNLPDRTTLIFSRTLTKNTLNNNILKNEELQITITSDCRLDVYYIKILTYANRIKKLFATTILKT